MSITYKLNKDKNGVEIKFTEKPSEKVREQMKKHIKGISKKY